MKQADKLWLERLQQHNPTTKGFLYGRNDPDQSFRVPSIELPQNYDYLGRWRNHLMLTRIGHPDDGLKPEEISVLMHSQDTTRKVKVIIFGTEYTYNAQFTKNTRIVKRLARIGLTYVISYKGGKIIDPQDGLPMGLKGCEWAWTPIGIAWVRQRLGLEQPYEPKLYRDEHSHDLPEAQ